MSSSKTPTTNFTIESSPSPPTDELPIRPYRGEMPTDFANSVIQGTWMSSPSYTQGAKIVFGTGEQRPDAAKKVFGERIYLPNNLHILIMHPLGTYELPPYLDNDLDLKITVALRRHLRWRNSEKVEVEAERVARYETTIVLKCFIENQGHLNQPNLVPGEDERFDALEAEEGFWSAGDVGVLLKKTGALVGHLAP